MKSREEIYQDCYNRHGFITYKELAYEAMQSYADQFAVEFAEWRFNNEHKYIGADVYTLTDLLTIFKKERGIE